MRGGEGGRRGRTSSLRGWRFIALVTAGRGGIEGGGGGGGTRWGGEGGGNPMRHREERQCEGNASQHRESLSISISLSFPLSSVCEA